MRQVLSIPVDSIDVGDRLRRLDADYVALIRASIEAHGLMQPIEVRSVDKNGQHVLISGAHRFAAVKALGSKEIDARVFEGDDVKAELRQIDENLFRRELSALDRATFLARRKELYEAENPETSQGKAGAAARWNATDKFVHCMPSFADATADKLRIDARSIRRAILRHQRLAPDVRTRISSTYLADKGSELDALARLEPAEQRKVVDHILAQNETRPSVSAAAAALRGKAAPQKPKWEKFYAAFLSLWKRAPARAQRAIEEFVLSEKARREAKR